MTGCRICCSTGSEDPVLLAALPFLAAAKLMYFSTCLAVSVLPAPDSPLISTELFSPTSIICE